MAMTTEPAASPGPAEPAEPAAVDPATVPAEPRRPYRLRQLRWSTWRGVLMRAGKGFVDDECADRAASMTYYGVLAIFPSLIVVVALVNLVADGDQAVDTILDVLADLGAASIIEDGTIEGIIAGIVNQENGANALLSFGVLAALWSASNFVASFTRASNHIYGVAEGRPFWKLRLLQIALSAVALVLLAVVAVGLLVSGPVTDAIGNALNIGDAARLTWTIGKWPALIAIMMLLLSLLFWIAPNVQQPRFRWLTVGGAVALLVWAIASFGFGLYVANFGNYDRTYGSIGAVIAFLVWLFLANCAVMLGVEINAELQRGRNLQAGRSHTDPPLPPRTPADRPADGG